MENRVCVNPDCKHHGAVQPAENFEHNRRTCKSCRRKMQLERQKKNERAYKESRRWIPDDEDESDLVPMRAGGFVRWAVISTERRSALGEASPHWGIGDIADGECAEDADR